MLAKAKKKCWLNGCAGGFSVVIWEQLPCWVCWCKGNSLLFGRLCVGSVRFALGNYCLSGFAKGEAIVCWLEGCALGLSVLIWN